MTKSLPASIVLIGAGKMGGAMLDGWLAQGLEPTAVTVLDPQPSAEMQALRAARGVKLNPPAAAVAPPAALVLAIKPQALAAAAPSIAPLAGHTTLVLSILAGKTIADLAHALPSAKAMVRAMPNLPASIGRGISAAVANRDTSDAQKAVADGLLASVGEVEWVDDEALLDAVTAVSGSGPAYVFYLAECLAAAGEQAGLPARLAARLARATVTGAGELLHRSSLSPTRLRQDVTSPGGTTAAALEVLMAENGLAPLMAEAVAAAKRRASELSG
jgi:pyrroline-5-carboxylate reductase